MQTKKQITQLHLVAAAVLATQLTGCVPIILVVPPPVVSWRLIAVHRVFIWKTRISR